MKSALEALSHTLLKSTAARRMLLPAGPWPAKPQHIIDVEKKEAAERAAAGAAEGGSSKQRAGGPSVSDQVLQLNNELFMVPEALFRWESCQNSCCWCVIVACFLLLQLGLALLMVPEALFDRKSSAANVLLIAHQRASASAQAAAHLYTMLLRCNGCAAGVFLQVCGGRAR